MPNLQRFGQSSAIRRRKDISEVVTVEPLRVRA
jgi:hypothetical protein